MKSPYQIAKELSVSPQAVYKRLTDEFNNQFNNHIQRTPTGQYKLDAVAERGLKALFNPAIEPVQQPTIEPVQQPAVEVVEPVQQPLLNQLNSENSFLRTRIELLEESLKIERTHSREQSDKLSEQAEKIIDLATQLAELNRNNQLLLGAEQSRNNHALLIGNESPKPDDEKVQKKGFLFRLFNRRHS